MNIIEIEIYMTFWPQQNLKSEKTFQICQTKIKIIESEILIFINRINKYIWLSDPQQNLKSEKTFQDWQTKIKFIEIEILIFVKRIYRYDCPTPSKPEKGKYFSRLTNYN